MASDRPILFSGPMVRALLAGTKTQTRRVVKPQPVEHPAFAGGAFIEHKRLGQVGVEALVADVMTYGAPGDRMWVRETFRRVDGQTLPWIETDYRATYQHGDRLGDHFGGKPRWTPAIHMPRHASRITLEITGVRVERLKAISEADAIAEGLMPLGSGADRTWTVDGDAASEHEAARDTYAWLWEQINGAGSWDANPWVWATTFKRVETAR
ncbi:hypothetical protein [Rubrivivax gelatinosus]|uniref:Phage-related protein n=1 Tax=Rubrivivax gelatinosus TaxID=28068 RepID=A0A4R2MFR3_RUBGE|nr:hypothetical protein [Rubrivivax gelatinosus]MBK1686235.1 hypothetical protein [Rubrivivax gelatinosus]TCP05732.1 hypothetical protein EV684_101606 [Rubrivivax gelatinosus]